MKRFLLILLLLPFFTACSQKENAEDFITSIIISQVKATHPYSSDTGYFTFEIQNPRTGVSLTAKSSETWIKDIKIKQDTVSYTVSENNSGADRTGTITLNYGNYANERFTVSQSFSAVSITLSPPSIAMSYLGGSSSFNFRVQNPREETPITVKSLVDWITDIEINESQISFKVSESTSGLARNGIIQLAYGNYATKDFTVNQSGKPIQSLSLNKSDLALLSGKSETLIAIVEPTDAPLQWSSNKTTVATVDQTGRVSAIGNGTATITVSAENGKSANCTVTVTTAVSGISLNKTSLKLTKGVQEQLTATISPSTASDKSVTWSSSNSGVATVDQSGNVAAVSYGTASITATTNDGSKKRASCLVNVPLPTHLSSNGSSNCYIVSSEGEYYFVTTQGNSSTSVGSVSSVVVLWESYGTSTEPSVGSIISNVSYNDNSIYFSTPTTLNNGNAVIAAKDASDNILWSWHIWVCKDYDPDATAQTYYHDGETMMDRNLGATSATPGDVGALGLLYQWGRKDPFLGSSSNLYSTTPKQAASTLSWPSSTSSNSSTGTIAYAVAHPTTFITNNTKNYDWYYSGSSSTNYTRWKFAKTIYDPCPPGWKVPTRSVWSYPKGSYDPVWDKTNKGYNFSKKFGDSSSIWYPAAGCFGGAGSLYDTGRTGRWWSQDKKYGSDYEAEGLYIISNAVNLESSCSRAAALSVRCVHE